MPWRITTDGAARAEGKRGYTMPSRDGGRQSQIRNYLTRGAGDPREQEIYILFYQRQLTAIYQQFILSFNSTCFSLMSLRIINNQSSIIKIMPVYLRNNHIFILLCIVMHHYA